MHTNIHTQSCTKNIYVNRKRVRVRVREGERERTLEADKQSRQQTDGLTNGNQVRRKRCGDVTVLWPRARENPATVQVSSMSTAAFACRETKSSCVFVCVSVQLWLTKVT